jgi:predicted transcriptional regulator
MKTMKPQVKEEEEVELTPEEEAMLDAAMAEADAGEYVDADVFLAELRAARPLR